MRNSAIGLLVAASLCRPSASEAQEPSLWSESLAPGCAEAAPIRRNLWSVVTGPYHHEEWILALSTANLAVDRCRDDPELRFLRARVLYELRRWDEAVADLRSAIDLDPEGTFALESAFTLGVTLTRLHRYEEASRAYRGFLDEEVWPQRRAIALTNLAETHMALDELEVARNLFVAAVAADPTYGLAFFGLAVVLDRIGEQGRALDEMLHGLSMGLGLEELLSDQVFYVPDWEIHYYRALAHEALGEYGLALTQWQAFLDGGGAGGPYSALVRAHIARLNAQPSP